MLSYLAEYEHIWGPLRVLRYITLRTLLAAGTATLVGFVIGPWLIGQLQRLKFGQHYDDDRTGDLASIDEDGFFRIAYGENEVVTE